MKDLPNTGKWIAVICKALYTLDIFAHNIAIKIYYDFWQF